MFSERQQLQQESIYFMYLMPSKICITIFSELFLEYYIFTNLTLKWV